MKDSGYKFKGVPVLWFFFLLQFHLRNGWKFQGSRWKFLGVPSWKFWEDLPAAGGNFEDVEMEIMKIVLENGENFRLRRYFLEEFCIFHQFDWKIRAEGAKKNEIFEPDLGASWKFFVES